MGKLCLELSQELLRSLRAMRERSALLAVAHIEAFEKPEAVGGFLIGQRLTYQTVDSNRLEILCDGVILTVV